MLTIAPAVLARFTDGIAFVAEAQPATTVQEFIDQLGVAAGRIAAARLDGAEDLETAATYLADAVRASGAERRVLTDKAVDYLSSARDMVDEYRLMA